MQGLSSIEAKNRLAHYGKNIVAEHKPFYLLSFAKKFWAPIPWMLEITIILELILHHNKEAVIILFLLVFNSILSFVQEERNNIN